MNAAGFYILLISCAYTNVRFLPSFLPTFLRSAIGHKICVVSERNSFQQSAAAGNAYLRMLITEQAKELIQVPRTLNDQTSYISIQNVG